MIDGGSTDESGAIIEKYAGRLAYAVSEKDNGHTDAINKGFARSTGDVLCWLNSDDLFLPGALECIGRSMRDGQFDFVYGDGWIFWDKSIRP